MCIDEHRHSPNIDFIKNYYFIFCVSITNILQTNWYCDITHKPKHLTQY